MSASKPDQDQHACRSTLKPWSMKADSRATRSLPVEQPQSSLPAPRDLRRRSVPGSRWQLWPRALLVPMLSPCGCAFLHHSQSRAFWQLQFLRSISGRNGPYRPSVPGAPSYDSILSRPIVPLLASLRKQLGDIHSNPLGLFDKELNSLPRRV
jgi:hypothetical protein